MIYDDFLFINYTLPHIRFTSNFALEKVSELLQAKGMTPEIATMRAKKVFAEQSDKATLYLHNIQHYFGAEIINKVYSFIMRKALYQEPIHFDSYDHLLRMMQDVYSSSLDEEKMKNIRQIAQANGYAIALIR